MVCAITTSRISHRRAQRSRDCRADCSARRTGAAGRPPTRCVAHGVLEPSPSSQPGDDGDSRVSRRTGTTMGGVAGAAHLERAPPWRTGLTTRAAVGASAPYGEAELSARRAGRRLAHLRDGRREAADRAHSRRLGVAARRGARAPLSFGPSGSPVEAARRVRLGETRSKSGSTPHWIAYPRAPRRLPRVTCGAAPAPRRCSLAAPRPPAWRR